MTTEALVEAPWLRAHLDDLVVLDATVTRDGDTYASGRPAFENVHIRSARFADLVTTFSDTESPLLFTRPSIEDFAAAAGTVGVGDGTHVVVYDRDTGAWAARLWWLFRSFGHERVSVLDGGLRAWQELGGPTESGPSPSVPRATLTAREDGGFAVVSTEDVAGGLRDGHSVQLVSALRSEAHDEAHIPGSVSRPYRSLIGPTGRLDQGVAAAMAREFADKFPTGVVAYCGGGINAAGLLLALHVGGYHRTALYDGSLAAWRAHGGPLSSSRSVDRR
jgi:thiosulfate/3-mercaptopyruvate sulfurtransferase